MRYLALRARGPTIEVALADGLRRPITWIIPHRRASVRRVVKLVSAGSDLRACCEDGPWAYGLFWQLAALGVCCDVVVPLGDVAELVSAHCAGETRLVWEPTAARAALAELNARDQTEGEQPPGDTVGAADAFGRDPGQKAAPARPVHAPAW